MSIQLDAANASQPGAARRCHTGCTHTHTQHTHASSHTYVLTVAHTLTYHLHSPDTLMWEVDCICLMPSLFLLPPLSSPLTQLFLSAARSSSPNDCLENVRSLRGDNLLTNASKYVLVWRCFEEGRREGRKEGRKGRQRGNRETKRWCGEREEGLER